MPELEDDGPPGQSGKARKKDKSRHVWISFVGRIIAQIIGAVASVLLGILVLQRYQETPSAPAVAAPTAPAAARTPGQRAIAVLPLDDFSPAAGDAYFAEGMTEVLISDLAQIKGWRVISRTSTAAYRNSGKSIAQIAAELQVDLIVEGSVTKAGDRVRVVVQLIDGKTDEHLWARSYDRPTRDVLAMQSELATEIAKSVKAAIVPEHEVRLAKRAAFNAAAFDLYLRGRHAWNLRTPDGLATAVTLFTEAIAKQPDFALAHVGLADAYSLGGTPSAGLADRRARMALARASAERALQLAAHLAEAHTALGGVQFFGERDFAAAERSFRHAIDLNPNYSVAHEWFAVMLAELGRDAEAMRYVETAVAVDPTEATMHQARGLVHYYAGRHGEAEAAERRALEIRPQLPLARVLLVKARLMAGNLEAASQSCDEAGALARGGPDLLLACGIAWHRRGDPRAAQALARLAANGPPAEPMLAQWHAATGDHRRALDLLERLRAVDNLPPLLAFDPLFAPLRADVRYRPLVKR